MKPASEKSLGFMRSLAESKDTEAFLKSLPDAWLCVYEEIVIRGNDDVAQKDVSKFIENMKALPYKPKPTKAVIKANPVTEDGMYMLRDVAGDHFFKVKHNQAGTRLYAERLVIHDEAVKGGHVKISFKYQAGAIHKLNADMKMSYDEAKAFGALYGSCVRCGRLLTNELSIALGIGPICGEREFGGEWPRLLEAGKLKAAK